MTRFHGGIVVGAAALIGAVVILTREIAPEPAAEAPKKSQPVQRRPAVPEPPRFNPASPALAERLKGLPALPLHELSPHAPGSPAERDWIAGRIEELGNLEWFDDFGSLSKILAELRNPLPEIRTAALAATRAFGSRDAIPYLDAISAEARDPSERKAIAEMIEYLNLPTAVEEFEGDVAE